MSDLPLIVVAGPTGSGKSAAALRIAETFSGEIVNCDSVQLYRGFDIGSAKLSAGERRGIPHHLIDVLDAEQVCTAGDYARRAREVIRDISDRGKLPVLSGGTGFYVRALLEGLFPGPKRNTELRARLLDRETERPGLLHRLLRRLDSEAARRIHPNDINKTIRAVEICQQSKRPVTEMFREGRDALQGYKPLKIALDPPRAELYERLETRTLAMFRAGIVAEVEHLLASGVSSGAKPFESIGYKQALSHINSQVPLKDVIEDTQRATRRYAKRQLTWLRRESNVVWVSGFGTDETTLRSIMNTISAYLDNTPVLSKKK